MQELFKRIVVRISDQYLTVLFVLGAVSAITYMVLITDIREQEGNARLVRMSAEQGQLVQNINLAITQKTYIKDPSDLSKLNAKIISSLIQLDESYISLSQGDRFVKVRGELTHISGQLSRELRQVYFDGKKPLDSLMRAYMLAARTLQKAPAATLRLDSPEVDRLFFTITPAVLEGINLVSSLHQRESEFMLGSTLNKQMMFFGLSLATLVFVGVLLLQPLVGKLKESAFQMAQGKAFSDNVINTTQALIIGLDPDGKVALFNHHAEESSGWSEEDVAGADFSTNLSPKPSNPIYAPCLTI